MDRWSWAVQKMTMNQRNTIDLEQGWDFMQKGITKLKNILEGLPEPQFSSEDYMMLYTYYSVLSINKWFIVWYISSFNESPWFYLAGQYTTCVLKSPHMIILNNCTTSTGSLLKSTLRQRYEGSTLSVYYITIYYKGLHCTLEYVLTIIHIPVSEYDHLYCKYLCLKFRDQVFTLGLFI